MEKSKERLISLSSIFALIFVAIFMTTCGSYNVSDANKPEAVTLTATLYVSPSATETPTNTFTPLPTKTQTLTPTSTFTPTPTLTPTPLGGMEGLFLYQTKPGLMLSDGTFLFPIDYLETLIARQYPYYRISLSPKGDQWLINGSDLSNVAVYLADISLKEIKKLALPKFPQGGSGQWSPTGDYILISGGDGNKDTFYTIRSDGTNLREVFVRLPMFGWLFWSSDGLKMYLSKNGKFYEINPDGSKIHSINLPGLDEYIDIMRLIYSGDRTKVAFANANKLYVGDADFTNLRSFEIPTMPNGSLPLVSQLIISDDGTKLLYSFTICEVGSCSLYNTKFFLLDTSDGAIKPLSDFVDINVPGPSQLCGFSKDNRNLIIYLYDPYWNAYMIDLEEFGKMIKITDGSYPYCPMLLEQEEIDMVKNAGLSDNLTTIRGGDFEKAEDLHQWDLELAYQQEVEAKVTIDSQEKNSGNSSAKINIIKQDGENWHIKFIQYLAGLKAKHKYTLSFEAKSEQPCGIDVTIQQVKDPWMSLIGYHYFMLTDKWQQFEVSESALLSEPTVQLEFLLGKCSGSIWIDDVLWQQISP